jgi:pteridine reductase
MTTRPDRPVALITGGAKRVGRAICSALARAGCDVVVTYRKSAHEATTLEAELNPARVQRVPLNLDDLGAVEETGKRLASTLGRLDIVVHNASIYGPKPLAELDIEHILSMYRVNAAAPLLLTKHLAPLLSKSTLAGGGSIVAMCDMHATGRPRKEMAAYSMSKAALIEMVQTLARELAPKVRVNGVAPGVVAFPESGFESDADLQRAYLSRVPLGRSGSPEEAAEVVRWLAVDATYVTGEIIRIDGGRWLA